MILLVRSKKKKNGIKEKLVGLELDGDPLTKAPENFWPVNNSEKKLEGSQEHFSHLD